MIKPSWQIKEHWRRLLAEFVVIAVGVMVALAVDNWNDARKDRLLEAEYLEGIAADLEASEWSLRETLERAEENQAALYQVIAIAEGEPPPPGPDLTRALIRSTYLGLPDATSITFDEITSTGSWRLIRDRALKRKLAEFYQRLEYGRQFYNEYRRKEAATEIALRGLLPLEARLDTRRIDEIPNVIDVEAVTNELRRREGLVTNLEDSVWTQMRARIGAEALLELIAELRGMLPCAECGMLPCAECGML